MKFMFQKLEIQHLKVIQPQKSNGENHKVLGNFCHFIQCLRFKLSLAKYNRIGFHNEIISMESTTMK